MYLPHLTSRSEEDDFHPPLRFLRRAGDSYWPDEGEGILARAVTTVNTERVETIGDGDILHISINDGLLG